MIRHINSRHSYQKVFASITYPANSCTGVSTFRTLSALALALVLPGCALFSGEPRFVAVCVAPAPAGPYSQAVIYGGLLFTAGFTPRHPVTGAIVEGDITAQTNRVLDNLEAVLKGAGCTLKDAVKVTVYRVDFADDEKMNAAMAARFGDHGPARTMVPIARFPGPIRLEVDLIARLP